MASVDDVADVIGQVFATEVLFTQTVSEGKGAVDVEATAMRAARQLRELGLLA